MSRTLNVASVSGLMLGLSSGAGRCERIIETEDQSHGHGVDEKSTWGQRSGRGMA